MEQTNLTPAANATSDVSTKRPFHRPLGSPNKATAQVRGLIQTVVENNLEKINTELAALTGKPYLDAVFTLMEFALPKLQRVEHQGEDGSKFIINILQPIKPTDNA